jgi:two-component system nitrate/nitrite response regulator NarL
MALQEDVAAGLTVGVVLAIDNEFMRNGIKLALRGIPGIADVRRGNVAEAVADPGESWRVVITSMAEWPCEDHAALPAERRPKVIVILHEQQIPEVDTVEGPQADGFLLTSELSRQTLQETIRRTLAGDLPMPALLARSLLTRASSPASHTATRPPSLTSREAETLGLLSDGYSNKQIARSLGISIHGAKRLVGAVLLKLGAPNRTAAVVTAIKRGLV